MRTRTLTGLSIALVATATGVAVLGRHTALPTATAGALLAAAVPCLSTAAHQHVTARCDAAYNQGYRCGIRHTLRGHLNR